MQVPFRGALPRLLHKVPASGVFWLLFETFRALLRGELMLAGR